MLKHLFFKSIQVKIIKYIYFYNVIKLIISCLVLFLTYLSYAQEHDTIPFTSFRDKIIVYTDLGTNSSHFTLKDDFKQGINKLNYKHNIKTILGFGFAYKWFAVHFGFALPGNLKSTTKYGDSKYFDLKLQGTYKQIYFYAGLRSYQGFYLKDEQKWNDSLPSYQPNGIYKNISSTNLEVNVYYFVSKKFDMHSVLGRVGKYNRFAQTVYFKNSINIFNINNKKESIIPAQLTDSTDRSNANSIGAFELTFIPGYAMVNSKNNWQYSMFAGIGVAFQSSYYVKGENNRFYTGLAPRFDLRMSFGYNVEKYFIHLEGNYNLRSVKVQTLKYNQSFYNARLVGGYRFQSKKTKKKENQQL